jgi:hypothetical protein
MAITTLEQLRSAPTQVLSYQKILQGTGPRVQVGYPTALAASSAGLTLGNTTTGIVPTGDTAGFPHIDTFGAGATGYLASLQVAQSGQGLVTIYDAVFGVGALSHLTVQTFTLASQPSYSGRIPNSDYTNTVLAWEVCEATSSGTSAVTVGYTNQDGTAGRVTSQTGMSGRAAGYVNYFTLQSGDTGVQSVQNITIVGTSLTTGSFNVWVLRKLPLFPTMSWTIPEERFYDLFETGLMPVHQDTALWVASAATSAGLNALFEIANG